MLAILSTMLYGFMTCSNLNHQTFCEAISKCIFSYSFYRRAALMIYLDSSHFISFEELKNKIRESSRVRNKSGNKGNALLSPLVAFRIERLEDKERYWNPCTCLKMRYNFCITQIGFRYLRNRWVGCWGGWKDLEAGLVSKVWVNSWFSIGKWLLP